jgi:glycosyltransferase involved in cell wall biosynthesis
MGGSMGDVITSDKSGVRVSVAIPTKNRPEKIRETVESILGGSRVPDEIVVSDQSTNEATRALVEQMRLAAGDERFVYVRSSRPGSSGNRNDALRAASGDFIALVDDDIRVDPCWLENLLREWKENWAGGSVLISGRILPGDAEAPFLDPGMRVSIVRTVFRKPPRTEDLLYGGAFAAPRELFDRLGPDPFDERLGVGSPFLAAGDEDFGYRALLAGFPVVYEPAITVTHYPEMARWRYSSFKRAYGGGAFFAKHILRGDWGLLRNFGWVLLVQVAKSFRSFFRFQAREGTTRLLAFAGLLTGFLAWAFSAQPIPKTQGPYGERGDLPAEKDVS